MNTIDILLYVAFLLWCDIYYIILEYYWWNMTTIIIDKDLYNVYAWKNVMVI